MIKVYLISWWLVTWYYIDVPVYDKFGHFIKNKSELRTAKQSNHCTLFTNRDSLLLFRKEFKNCYDCDFIEVDTFQLNNEEVLISKNFCKQLNNQ